MSENVFYFRAHLMVPVSSAIVFGYLTNTSAYPEWWGSVVKRSLPQGNTPSNEVGAKCTMDIRGLLPIVLHLEHTVKEITDPSHILFETHGDLSGMGRWTLEDVDAGCRITFEWSITPERKLIRTLSPFLRPVFRMHHKYCLRQAGLGLKREIVRKLNRLPLSSVPMF